MDGRTYPMQGEKPNLPYKTVTTPGIVANRVEIIGGGFSSNGTVCVVNITYKTLVSATGSPGILSGLPHPLKEAALSCIDITSGIASAIDGSVPAGISQGGTIYQKETTSNHVYAMSGVYLI